MGKFEYYFISNPKTPLDVYARTVLDDRGKAGIEQPTVLYGASLNVLRVEKTAFIFSLMTVNLWVIDLLPISYSFFFLFDSYIHFTLFFEFVFFYFDLLLFAHFRSHFSRTICGF